jgi:glycosyltransferase involved in cell wall biosynthesis
VLTMNGHTAYQDMILRVQEVVRRTLPPDATVIVVSKGDRELLDLDGRTAWHFPQREDGIYAGYYPSDSATAIAHLEALQAKGGQYLLFPETAFWWLDHYKAFKEHLESRSRPVAHEDDTCLIFDLSQRQVDNQQPLSIPDPVVSDQLAESDWTLDTYIDASLRDDLNILFDPDYYAEQAGTTFSSFESAVIHYLEEGAARGYNPHPLFDTVYYLHSYPKVRWSGANPLIHFLSHSVEEGRNPNPYFDTEHYYSQGSGLRNAGVNALVHYLTHAIGENAYNPNPLFINRFYVNQYRDVVKAGINPLAHYVQYGWQERRFVSHVHRNMVQELFRSSRSALRRGRWKHGSILLFAEGASSEEVTAVLQMADLFARDHHLNCMVVLFKRQGLPPAIEHDARVLVLEDFQIACDIFRPSALQTLASTLRAMQPRFTISTVAGMAQPLKNSELPFYYLCPEEIDHIEKDVLENLVRTASRVIFPSSAAFHTVAHKVGFYAPRVALRPPDKEGYVDSLLELARRDFHLPEGIPYVDKPKAEDATRKVIIPCCDWGISGVNSSLEALGQELMRLGWDVEVLFTRDELTIAGSAGGDARMPKVPFRFLEPEHPGIEGMWEALISYLEQNAPCIMFMSYDFNANAVAPALTDRVGVVAWVQADDGDYYEQAYRLGRYCNALVCVSTCIKEGVAALNPLIGEKAHVIYNSSIRESYIIEDKPAPTEPMRLIYTGRLVQYQKRILDFIALAQSLDKTEIPYQLTLVGDFSPRENTRELFELMAATHIADGRIRLPGRMTHEQILEELRDDDLFILLSDFEGLPLSLVEAMANGCVPVVAQMDSGIGEAITNGQNGLIVSGRDYDDWAALLADLWQNPEQLLNLSQRARETVCERFTIEQVGRQFDGLFRRIAEEIHAEVYQRPPSLNWGEKRSPAGDVLPPPNMYRPPMFNHRVAR